jgi:hypothetical protein
MVPGSALKVSVVWVVWWANPLLCLTQLELRLSWVVTISGEIYGFPAGNAGKESLYIQLQFLVDFYKSSDSQTIYWHLYICHYLIFPILLTILVAFLIPPLKSLNVFSIASSPLRGFPCKGLTK